MRGVASRSSPIRNEVVGLQNEWKSKIALSTMHRVHSRPCTLVAEGRKPREGVKGRLESRLVKMSTSNVDVVVVGPGQTAAMSRRASSLSTQKGIQVDGGTCSVLVKVGGEGEAVFNAMKKSLRRCARLKSQCPFCAGRVGFGDEGSHPSRLSKRPTGLRLVIDRRPSTTEVGASLSHARTAAASIHSIHVSPRATRLRTLFEEERQRRRESREEKGRRRECKRSSAG